MRWPLLALVAVAGGAAGAPVPPPGPPRPVRKVWVPAAETDPREGYWRYCVFEDVPGIQQAGRQYNGTVTAVSRAGITLADPETAPMDQTDLKALYNEVVLEKGKGWMKTEYRAKKPIPPRRFAASKYQAAGVLPVFPEKPQQPGQTPLPPIFLGYPPRWYGHVSIFRYYYLLDDVQVGDKVNILFSRLGDTDVVDGVSIVRRPGGRIPYSRLNEDDFPPGWVSDAMLLVDGENEYEDKQEEAAKAKAAESKPKK